RPNYVFGGFGLANLALGFLAFDVVAYRVLVLRHYEATPLVFVMMLLLITGTLSLFIGFLAEIVIRGFYDTQRKPTYYVRAMAGEDRRVWVVFNGEIYNYRELTRSLAARGHTFATRSDTEVIVHGLEDRGVESIADLEGMFAFAAWDEPASTLVLARDRLGIKPLYYAVLPDQLVFASELRALVEHPEVDR